jgi:chromosome segregation ATPase
MIEHALVFLLGMLSAGLLWLMLLPAFWRRAVRLTSRRIERALPLSLNEIAAERDRLRAGHGVALARIDAALQRARMDLAAAKAETGERLKAEAGFLDTIAAERQRVSALQAEAGGLRVELQTRDVRIADLVEARDLAEATIAGLEAQRVSLAGRLASTSDLAENRRLALDETRLIAERANEAHAAEAARNAQLRTELQARETELREALRKLASLEQSAVLTRIRGGEETYQSVVSIADRRQAK